MDAIDPSITDLGIFDVPASPCQTKDGHDRDEMPNVFRLNEYVTEHSQPHEENSTAAAALNMIQYGFENEIASQNIHPHQHSPLHPQYHHDHIASALTSLEQPPFAPSLATAPLSAATAALTVAGVVGRGDRSGIQQPRPTSGRNIVTVVPYNPNEKPKRLGRPRKHQVMTHNPPQSRSAQNVNELMVSKFRFDQLPVEGPGSRGGKGGGARRPAAARGRIRGTKFNGGLGPVSDLPAVLTSRRAKRTAPKDEDEEAPPAHTDDLPLETILTAPLDAADIQRHTHEAKLAALAQAQARTRAPNPSMFTKKPSRTTVSHYRNKLSRLLPAPLVGINYTLYDDNVILAEENADAAKEKLALGHAVRIAPHAADIMTIITFLNRYKAIVFGKEEYYIGPQDFEHGLSLPRYTSRHQEDDFVVYRQQDDATPYNPDYVSPLMTLLFCRLLALVLNKKKPVSTRSQRSAIGELKSMVASLGLAHEWLDTLAVLAPALEAGDEDVDAATPVDPKHPDAPMLQNLMYYQPAILYNPFKDAEFVQSGLMGLTPTDRLKMLRTLVQWSLITAEPIKTHIYETANYQDVGGERSTYYGARSVLKGFKNAETVSRETQIKINKKLSSKKEADGPELKDDTELKYVDPVSDPLAHPLRWRLNEMLVGDIGFNVGRFYLCRMADAAGGGLASIKRMQTVCGNARELRDIPSPFKLYVEDVHQMLIEDLAQFGMEFDAEGKEVELEQVTPTCNWYEVASNAAEFLEFIAHLSNKLEHLPSMLVKQVTSLRDYLAFVEPLVARQESASAVPETLERSSRKRTVNYDLQTAASLEDEDDDEYMDEGLDEVEEPAGAEDDEDYLE